MNSFTYNGVNSLDMGLRIENKRVFNAPKFDSKFQQIPGRDGDLILPDGRYQNVQITYSVFLPAKSTAELQEKVTAVKSWLYTQPDRYHDLRDTYDTECFRRAVLNNALDIEDELNKIGVFTVSFSCLPFKYLDSGQTAVSLTSGGGSMIVNPTFFDARPLIRINGSGDGTLRIVNQKISVFEVSGIDSFLYIDSVQMNCYKGSVSMNGSVEADSFPVLNPGQNIFMFSGGITSIEVTLGWVTL